MGVSIIAVEAFLRKKRVLYAAPTAEQLGRFWQEVSNALIPAVDAGIYTRNISSHVIELPGTENRIKAKTAWNADTLRGDYADLLILDEFQLMSEDTWDTVGAPMMLDKDGDVVFIYTPPSLHSRSASKASDPQHASKLYKKAALDQSGRWACFTFTSFENPFLSTTALQEITSDMTSLAYRMEIEAQDVDESPGALWTRQTIENSRVIKSPDLTKIVVGVDPAATSTGDETGIITVGKTGGELYTLADDSLQGTPLQWARAAVVAFHRWNANYIVAEGNNGGEMVTQTIRTIDPSVKVRLVHASRGKATRAEPIAAVAEQGKDHHVGTFPALEDELCLWTPGDNSPNRLDAKVWACSDLLNKGDAKIASSHTG